MNNKIIYGHVPGAPMLPPSLPEGLRVDEDEDIAETPKPRKGPKKRSTDAQSRDQSWRKGYPRNTRKQDIIEGRAVPLSSAPPAMAEAPNLGFCLGCKAHLMTMSMPLLRELVRVARERIAVDEGAGARTDILFLAARLDGYCSLGCWKDRAPKAMLGQLFGPKP